MLILEIHHLREICHDELDHQHNDLMNAWDKRHGCQEMEGDRDRLTATF